VRSGCQNYRCGSSDIDGMIIVFVGKDDDPAQLRMEDIYDHSFVSTIQHHILSLVDCLAEIGEIREPPR
jgi:hypothetical protein